MQLRSVGENRDAAGSGALLEFDAELAQGAPGDAAVLRAMAGDEQGEALRDAAHGPDLELGAAIGEIADDAAFLGAAAIEGNDGGNHGVVLGMGPDLVGSHISLSQLWHVLG